jgi:hypothetical protein
MAYPENPKTIVIQNEYYPKGLTELDIWNYYQKVKSELLTETRLKDLMFFIMVDVNTPVIRRKLTENYIRLDPNNYDTLITGRTVSIHSSMGMYEQHGIIDVDVDPSDGFKWSKKVTMDTYDYVMDKIPLIKKVQIRFTGKNSFHLVCDFGRKLKIDTMNDLLNRFLSSSPLIRNYTVSGKRTPGIPNLDLHPNKYKGNYITLHSLSVIGLKCMEIQYNQLLGFDPRKARI